MTKLEMSLEHLESPESFFMVYTWYIPGIFHIPGIYKEYTRYIPAIFQENDFQINHVFINSNAYMALVCIFNNHNGSVTVSVWGLKRHKIYGVQQNSGIS
jgi:hypothetical protein